MPAVLPLLEVADVLLILGCCLILGMLFALLIITGALQRAFNVKIFGTHPFAFVGNAIFGNLSSALTAAIALNQHAIVTLWAGLVWTTQQMGKALGAFAGYVYGALYHLRHVVIPVVVNTLLGPIAVIVYEVRDDVSALIHAVGHDGSALAAKVDAGVSRAETYADTKITALKNTVAHDIDSAIETAGKTAGLLAGQAINYTVAEVKKLQGELDSVPSEIRDEIAKLGGIASKGDIAEAIAAALLPGGVIAAAVAEAVSRIVPGLDAPAVEHLIAGALAEGGSIKNAIEDAVRDVAGGVSAARVAEIIADDLVPGGIIFDAIGRAIAGVATGLSAEQVDAHIMAAIEGALTGGGAIDDVIEGVRDRISDEIDKLKNIDIGTLTTGLAAVAATVAVLELETGLGNESCRTKVKGICGTDPAAWAELLAGLAVLGFAFSLRDLYDLAEPLVGELSDVIAEAA